MKLPILLTKEPKILQVGGAMIGNKEMLSKFMDINYNVADNQFLIAINYLLKDNLTEREFMAIAYHELAHYKLGHLFKGYATNPKLEQELEADRYSAAKVSAIDLYNALRKLPAIYKAYTTAVAKGKQDEFSRLKKIDLFIDNINNQMKPRYDALIKMTKDQNHARQ